MVRGSFGIDETDINFPATALGGTGTTMKATVTADQPLPGYIANTDMDISWEVSFDGGKTWSPVGATDNHLYLTGRKVSGDTAYETVLALGCMAANTRIPGEDDGAIVVAVFGEFQGLNVWHIQNGLKVGQPMWYYSPKGSGGTSGDNGAWHTLAYLLSASDGRCEAWADFFLAACDAQIKNTGDLKYVTITPAFRGAPPAQQGFKPVTSAKQLIDVQPDARAQGPDAGGDIPPFHLFNNHAVVVWKTAAQPGWPWPTYTLCDPSYGLLEEYPGPKISESAGPLWEHAALQGIALPYLPDPYTGRGPAPMKYFDAPLSNIGASCNYSPDA